MKHAASAISQIHFSPEGSLVAYIDFSIGRAVKILLCIALIATLAGGLSLPQQPGDFSPRLTTPRIAPVAEQGRTEAQREMLASRPDFNIYKTLAHHPELYSRWSGLGGFLLNGSSLPPRHREMVMLRMGWLCQSEYEWAQHARIATSSAGMTDQEVHRIAEGPKAPAWTDFERTLLRMVDELRYEAMVDDLTWRALRAQYSDQQMMEAVFTAAQYQLVSMALNSLGVQLDPGLQHRLPRDLPLPKLAGSTNRVRLSTPRIAPLTREQWTAQQRELITPQVRADGTVPNLYATMIQHPRLYAPRQSFGSYLRTETSLPPKTREVLIMRTAFLIGAEYEWAHHAEYARAAGLTDGEITRIAAGPDAAGWSEEQRSVLQAADELRREAFITDRTWGVLAKHYNNKQLLEIVFTVGGYTMTGLAINSFGIQVEPGYPGFPRSSQERGKSQAASRGERSTW
ncbi:MAG TPA: carboxymuconolactone decarboxylase family protein [Blastocatellia bacterium]|nr:carboxymuconolactone decarboxylase family protein [Blastocatellia bacterium]